MDNVIAGTPGPESHRLEFTGSGREYFRIWIVNLALSLATLGIYSAWAKVRRMKYFYGNTSLAGHAFDYHGRPIAILKGRLIAVLFLVIYLVVRQFAPRLAIVPLLLLWLAIPWIVTRARMFQLRVTSYRGVHFDFQPDYRGAYVAYLLAPIATVLSLGIALPWATRVKYRWLIDNSAYGATRFTLAIGLKGYVRALLIVAPVLILGMIAVGIVSFGAVGMAGKYVGLAPGSQPTPQQTAALGMLTVAVMYPFLLLLTYAVMGLWRALVLTPTLSATTLGQVRLHCSLPAARLMWIYISNLLGIVFTIGLFTPWARVRLARFVLQCTGYEAPGPVDDFVGTELVRTPAVAEEIGDLFDIDFGL